MLAFPLVATIRKIQKNNFLILIIIDIEKMPVTANTADVIVSNCVLNLVPNKDAVIKEFYRVLKPGGHFSISNIVLEVNYQSKSRKQQKCMQAV